VSPAFGFPMLRVALLAERFCGLLIVCMLFRLTVSRGSTVRLSAPVGRRGRTGLPPNFRRPAPLRERRGCHASGSFYPLTRITAPTVALREPCSIATHRTCAAQIRLATLNEVVDSRKMDFSRGEHRNPQLERSSVAVMMTKPYGGQADKDRQHPCRSAGGSSATIDAVSHAEAHRWSSVPTCRTIRSSRG
jgi:hypothetical protein